MFSTLKFLKINWLKNISKECGAQAECICRSWPAAACDTIGKRRFVYQMYYFFLLKAGLGFPTE